MADIWVGVNGADEALRQVNAEMLGGARALADQGAAVLLLEKDCQGDALYEQADGLLRDRPRREEMVRALNSMAVPDAGEKIYQTLREVMETRRTK